ncbi:hypothetical protein F2Q69_00028979 [Brassica cretica]|uniref:Uncharacterized protein n=1 Tax=Brassica cretica TaxID=69181 RepID=A0A8S9RS54_BRACR|nr:hypothetical protein F2Q69_00028979 [Brassica cretica]
MLQGLHPHVHLLSDLHYTDDPPGSCWSPFSFLISTRVTTMLFVRGSVSIDALIEVSIVALSQVSIDEEELVSIDAAHFSLRIVHSKRGGSEKKSNTSLLLLLSKFCVQAVAREQGANVDRCYGQSRSMLLQTSVTDLIDYVQLDS